MGAHSAPPAHPPLSALIGAGAALFAVLIVAAGLASVSMTASVTVIVLTFLTGGGLAVLRSSAGRYWQRYTARWVKTALVLGLLGAYVPFSGGVVPSAPEAVLGAVIGFGVGALFGGSLINLIVAAIPSRGRTSRRPDRGEWPRSAG